MRQGSWPNLMNVSLEISIGNTGFLVKNTPHFARFPEGENGVFNTTILHSYCMILVRSESKWLQHPAISIYLLTNSTRNTTITYLIKELVSVFMYSKPIRENCDATTSIFLLKYH